MFGPGAAERHEEGMEGRFDDSKRFAAKAAPVVANIGRGILKGATAGAGFGGPVGAIIGDITEGVGTGLSSYAKGRARNIGNILGTVTNVAGQISPTGRLGGSLGSAIGGLAGAGGKGAAAGAAVNALSGFLGGGGARDAGGALGALTSLFGGSNAANQRLSLLRRPETVQALGALAMGPAGKPSVPTGPAQTPVPTSACPELIKLRSEQIVAEAAALSDGAESTLRYMTDETGEFVGDPASDTDNAERLWEMLNEAQAGRVLDSIYQELTASSPDEAAYRPHCGAYREDIYGTPEYEVLYGFTAEDLDQDYPEDQGENFAEEYDSEWAEDTSYEYA